MTEHATNEDILAALDELFEALGTTNAAIAALHKKLDRQREVALETLKHCERLVKKDEDMMRSMGIYGLVRRANEGHTEVTAGGMVTLRRDTDAAGMSMQPLSAPDRAAYASDPYGLPDQKYYPPLSAPGRAAQDALHNLGERIKKL